MQTGIALPKRQSLVAVKGTKVELASVYSLNAWFYAARWEGINLRDMWLKAQTLEDEIWICHTMEMDQWNHEPYV